MLIVAVLLIVAVSLSIAETQPEDQELRKILSGDDGPQKVQMLLNLQAYMLKKYRETADESIPTTSFRDVLTTLYKNLSEKELEYLVHLYDSDGSGKVSASEFNYFVMRHHYLYDN